MYLNLFASECDQLCHKNEIYLSLHISPKNVIIFVWRATVKITFFEGKNKRTNKFSAFFRLKYIFICEE